MKVFTDNNYQKINILQVFGNKTMLQQITKKQIFITRIKMFIIKEAIIIQKVYIDI